MERMRRYALSLCAVALVAATPVLASAQESSLLPSAEFGVDLTQFVPVVLAAFGSVIAAVLGGYFLIHIIRGGMRWIRSYNAR